jgi:hypothetical protein
MGLTMGFVAVEVAELRARMGAAAAAGPPLDAVEAMERTILVAGRPTPLRPTLERFTPGSAAAAPPPGTAAPAPGPSRQPDRRAEATPGGSRRVGPRLRPYFRSANWAGAAIPAPRGQSFSRVVAGWKVPAVRPLGTDDPEQTRLVSAWVGLGGEAPWADSMPQMGSEHGWYEGVQRHRLWCQWWRGSAVDDGLVSHLLADIPTVVPGAEVLASLTLETPTTALFEFRLADHVFAVRATCDRPAIANSANWIVEKPSKVVGFETGDLSVGPLRPLPWFKRVDMTGCAARAGSAVLYPYDRERIALYGIARNPSRLFLEIDPAVTVASGATGARDGAARLRVIQRAP